MNNVGPIFTHGQVVNFTNLWWKKEPIGPELFPSDGVEKMGLNPQIKQTTEKQKPLDSRQPILVNISMMRLQHNI